MARYFGGKRLETKYKSLEDLLRDLENDRAAPGGLGADSGRARRQSGGRAAADGVAGAGEADRMTTYGARGNPCFLCGSVMHFSSACPDALCFNCLLPGHRSSDCKEPRRPSRYLLCSKCLKPGHDGRSCPEAFLFGQRLDPSIMAQAICVACGNAGHVDCSMASADRLLAAGKLSCFNCGATGHAGYDCIRWQRQRAGVGAAPPSRSQTGTSRGGSSGHDRGGSALTGRRLEKGRSRSVADVRPRQAPNSDASEAPDRRRTAPQSDGFRSRHSRRLEDWKRAERGWPETTATAPSRKRARSGR